MPYSNLRQRPGMTGRHDQKKRLVIYPVFCSLGWYTEKKINAELLHHPLFLDVDKFFFFCVNPSPEQKALPNYKGPPDQKAPSGGSLHTNFVFFPAGLTKIQTRCDAPLYKARGLLLRGRGVYDIFYYLYGILTFTCKLHSHYFLFQDANMRGQISTQKEIKYFSVSFEMHHILIFVLYIRKLEFLLNKQFCKKCPRINNTLVYIFIQKKLLFDCESLL